MKAPVNEWKCWVNIAKVSDKGKDFEQAIRSANEIKAFRRQNEVKVDIVRALVGAEE